jgi:hypothetical protein
VRENRGAVFPNGINYFDPLKKEEKTSFQK